MGELLQFPCKEWTGLRSPRGYGRIQINKKGYLAHRLAWERANGKPVPKGMYVLHKCDNPPCIEPTHLFLGTHKDNMEDMVKKGRHKSGWAIGRKTSNGN